MPMDGTVSDIIGYPGLAYQAIRYEPLCGNMGTDARYKGPIDLTDRCIPAMESFGNNTELTLALYDITGTRLSNARVAGGRDVCMCFAMSQVSTSLKGAFCFWIDGTGNADRWWTLHLDHILAGSYRPNVAKSLPLCKNADVDQLRSQWSSTAVQPAMTERVSTVGAAGTKTKVVVSTIVPSMVTYTTLRTITTTNGNGSPTIQVVAETTQAAVVTVEPENRGLSRSDKIALGVGLGIGIPTMLLMILLWYLN
ncbi:hypothetical protein GQ44DRAFT_772378 [Phaeosphaeriaceae sp. PMI808]|nr:hypothetical protein GQ44DRAFT_772378 [Phaeosphaeriaceae sp. PMI808]